MAPVGALVRRPCGRTQTGRPGDDLRLPHRTRAGEGRSVGTIDLACSAISHHHRSHCLDDPILAEGMRQVRRGLRRLIGAAPRRQARPLGTEDIRQILDAIDRSSAKAPATPRSSCSGSRPR